MAKQRHVAVSQLARYAADPARYCCFKGGTENQRAATYGTKAHDRLVTISTGQILLLILLAVIGAALISDFL